jgi:hypothetical protein
VKAAIQGAPREVGIDLADWNWKVVRQFVRERFGLALGRSGCLKYLHRLGFVLKRPKKRLLKANPWRRAVFVREYVLLRATAAETGTKIFFADEAHFYVDADLRGKWVSRASQPWSARPARATARRPVTTRPCASRPARSRRWRSTALRALAGSVTSSRATNSSSEAPIAFLTASGLRPVAITAFPAARAALAMSTPMPRPAPVMNQTFFSLMRCSSFHMVRSPRATFDCGRPGHRCAGDSYTGQDFWLPQHAFTSQASEVLTSHPVGLSTGQSMAQRRTIDSAGTQLSVAGDLYSSSVTRAPHVALLPWSSISHIAICVMKWSGAAPCQCHLPGGV